ncbi:MAG: hypothetical protein AAF458_18760 [Pseudomonadota bacterium]
MRVLSKSVFVPKALRFTLTAGISALLFAGPAQAVQIQADWVAGTGDWSTGSNWTFGPLPTARVFPNNDTLNNEFFEVRVDSNGGTNSVVTMDTPVTIDRLQIDSGDRLNITSGDTLSVASDAGRATSGVISNSGSILIQTSGGFDTLRLIGGTVELTGDGNGVITLDDSASANRARILGASGGGLDNINNLIHGAGAFGSNSLTLANRAGGTIEADVSAETLTVDADAGGLTNEGMLRATNQARLLLSGTTVHNAGGTIEADAASTVELSGSSRINGGTLTGAGEFVSSGSTTLDGIGMTLDGVTFQVNNGTTTTLLGDIDLIDNSRINVNGTGGFTDLIIDGTATLGGDGTGVVTLDDTADSGRSRIRGLNSGHLIIDDGNTIQGEGQLGNGSTRITNRNGSLIDANASGQILQIDTSAAGMANSATVRASNGGRLVLNSGTVDNTGGLIQATGGTTVELTGSVVVSGGEVRVDSNAVLEMDTGTIQSGTTNVAANGLIEVHSPSRLSGLVNNDALGTIKVLNGDTLTFDSGGTYNNAGLIELESTGGFTDLIIDGAVGLAGGGRLVIGDSAGTGRARVRGVNTGVLSNTSHTIEGEGQLGSGSTDIQNLAGGVIDANVAGREFTVNTAGSATNSGEMRSSGGGLLNIVGGTVNNAGGTIRATNGSTTELSGAAVVTGGTVVVEDGGVLDLNSATVQGGTVTVANGGEVIVSSASTLSGLVQNALGGNISVENGRTLTLNSAGTYQNAGEIKLAGTGGFTDLVLDGAVQLSGGGTLIMEDTLDLGRARIRGVNTGVLTNTNHTIRGQGELGSGAIEIRNLAGGIIEADQSTRSLTVNADGQGVTNSGTMRATSGAELFLSSETVQNAGGVIESQTGSTVTFGGTDVIGGTLTGPGAFIAQTGTVLDGVGMTIDGATVDINNGRSMTMTGDFDLNNGGRIDINSDGGFTDLIINGTVTFDGDGTGVVSLNDTTTFNRTRVRGVNNGVIVNRNATIQGVGQLGNNSADIANEANGVIQANVSGRTLTVAPFVGMTNEGVIRASNGGTLLAAGGTFSNAGGTVEALDGSTVQFSGTAVMSDLTAGGELAEGAWRAIDGGAGATLQVDNASAINAIGINASVELSGANSSFSSGGIAIDDTLVSNAGTFALRDGRTFATSASMTNTGTVVIDGAGTQMLVSTNYQQSAGRTELNGGELIAVGGVVDFSGGTLSGSGTIRGTTTFGSAAVIDAGFSPGIINFGDDTTFDGRINIELDGLLVDGAAPNVNEINVGTDPLTTGFDQLNILAGTANLLDSLTIDIALNFVPSANDFFDIITADVLNVDLTQITFLMPSSFSASVVSLFDPSRQRNAQALRLTFNGQTSAPVPAPGTLLLAALALLAVRGARRRAR